MKKKFLKSQLYAVAALAQAPGPLPTPKIENVLKVEDWLSGLNLVANILIYLAGIIFIGMFLLGGVQYLTAGGNQAQVDKAKKTLLWAVVGLLAVLSAFVIVNLIISAVK